MCVDVMVVVRALVCVDVMVLVRALVLDALWMCTHSSMRMS